MVSALISCSAVHAGHAQLEVLLTDPSHAVYSVIRSSADL